MSAYDALVDRALKVAREAVQVGGRAALRWWRANPPVEQKPDGSPVSLADREAEAAMLGVLESAFPGHDVLSEESGTRGRGGADWRWLVDPIDGTRGFLRGDPVWGPMLALEHQGEVVVAAMALPAARETFWAWRGGGCWRDGERCRVSAVDRLADATLALGYLRGLLAPPHGAGVLELISGADRVRCPGDLAGPALLLAGRADAWLEAGVHAWDLAPARLLVCEAGGRFTDFLGRPCHNMGAAVGTNGRIHDEILRHLRAA